MDDGRMADRDEWVITCPLCKETGNYKDVAEIECSCCGATLRTSSPPIHYWAASNQRIDGGFNVKAACGYTVGSRRPKAQKRFTKHLTDVTCKACYYTKLFQITFKGETFLREPRK